MMTATFRKKIIRREINPIILNWN